MIVLHFFQIVYFSQQVSKVLGKNTCSYWGRGSIIAKHKNKIQLPIRFKSKDVETTSCFAIYIED